MSPINNTFARGVEATKQTKHYVAIESHCGYVWEEADAETPLEAVAAIIEKSDPGYLHGRWVEACPEHELRRTDRPGFYLYVAPEGWVEVEDGRSRAEIKRVKRECEYEGSFRVFEEGSL